MPCRESGIIDNYASRSSCSLTPPGPFQWSIYAAHCLGAPRAGTCCELPSRDTHAQRAARHAQVCSLVLFVVPFSPRPPCTQGRPMRWWSLQRQFAYDELPHITRFVWPMSQLVSSIFLSHQINTGYQADNNIFSRNKLVSQSQYPRVVSS